MRPKFLRDGRRAGLDWAQIALFVWTIVLLVVCVRSAIQPRKRSLFYTWATAGSDWIAGQNLYYHDPRPDDLDLFRYSPVVAVSFTPLSFLNERAGNILWRLFDAGVFLGGLWWWLRTVLPGTMTNSLKALVLLLVVPLSLASMNNGQTNPLVIGFLLTATAALHGKRWNLAALFITMASALKVYPLAVGLLLVLIYPRQLSWRLALLLLATALVPFCVQRPAYVFDQYRQWFQFLGHDDRKNIALNIAYRDLWLLFRLWRPITPGTYLVIQLALAAFCAGLCLAMVWKRESKTRQTTTALMLGCCWMMLCGPATESSSFVQLAPALAWGLIAARLECWPLVVRWLPLTSAVLFSASVLAGLTPWTGEVHSLGLQPLGTLLLLGAYGAVALRAILSMRNNGEAGEIALTARAA